MDRLPVQPIRPKRRKSDNDSKQLEKKKKEAINFMDNPKKLQVCCVIIVSFVTDKDVFGTLK